MQEVVAPYDDLSKCAKQQLDGDKSTHLSLSEDSEAGVNRLAMLRARRGFLSSQGQDAVFEFTFVRQSPMLTLIEFRNAGSTAHSDIAWNAIAECSDTLRAGNRSEVHSLASQPLSVNPPSREP